MATDLKVVNNEFDDFLNTLPKEFDIGKIRRAYEFAKRAHVFQKRKSGEPFISHPLQVAKIVNEVGLDEQSIISAFLHDVVEDTEATLEEVKAEFGEEIELIVDGLTKITYFGRKKEEVDVDALRKILLASAKDIRILVIKLCDRLHNMRTISEMSEEKQKRIASETLSIYVPIAQKVGMYSLKWELEDLALKYYDREMYDFIKKKLNLKRSQREEIVKRAVEEIKEALKEYDIGAIALGRPKNFYSIYKKIRDKARSFEEIYDLYAIRVIANNISDCYTVLGALHDKFQAFPDKLKDYIANPKANGYQSIHTVVYSRAIKAPVEIQIRTQEMHKLAEFGIAAHWRYKNIKEDQKFEKKIGWLREILQWEKEHKDNNEFLRLLKFDFFEDEIFVFTPKNDIIILPEGASVLDFAYSVHTHIGDKAYKAKVNGVISTIDKTLKSGDIVEIITHNSSKPNDKWLKFVKTNKARIKIRNSMNLKLTGKERELIDEVPFEKLLSKIKRTENYKKTRKAGCCKIEFGDQIVGVIGKNKELVIHNASCENAKYTIKDKIQLRWVEEKQKEVSINLVLKDKIGLLMDILNLFNKSNTNILSVNSKTLKNGDVRMELTLLDGPHVSKLVADLKNIDSVEQVKESRSLFF